MCRLLRLLSCLSCLDALIAFSDGMMAPKANVIRPKGASDGEERVEAAAEGERQEAGKQSRGSGGGEP